MKSYHEKIMEKYKCALDEVERFDKRERNIAEGRELCERCDGTGREFGIIINRRCRGCNGKGYR